MENSKNIKKNVGTIIGIIFMIIFVIVNIPGVLECFINNNKIKENIICLKVILDILYCVIIIPILFTVLTIKDIEKCYYYLIPLAYILLPFVLFLRNFEPKKTCIAIVTLITYLVIIFSIYILLKKVKEINIQYLKFSHLVISSFFAIVCTLLDLICDELNVKMLFFSASLLLPLQILYEKLGLDRKKKNGDTGYTFVARFRV